MVVVVRKGVIDARQLKFKITEYLHHDKEYSIIFKSHIITGQFIAVQQCWTIYDKYKSVSIIGTSAVSLRNFWYIISYVVFILKVVADVVKLQLKDTIYKFACVSFHAFVLHNNKKHQFNESWSYMTCKEQFLLYGLHKVLSIACTFLLQPYISNI